MALLLLILLPVHGVSAVQTIPSFNTENPVIYNCPPRQTIETAYWDYCRAESATGIYELDGVHANVDYDNAPDSYTTSPRTYYQSCSYVNPEDAADTLICYYSAGGGEPLIFDPDYGEQSGECPVLDNTVPRPSPGVDYRRRSQMNRRVILGARPEFVCPWTSDQNDFSYVRYPSVDAGSAATEASQGVGLPDIEEGQLFIGCGLALPDTTCYYVQDGATVTFSGSFGNRDDLCPQTLCDAIYSYRPPTKRGIYLEGSAYELRSRQVTTKELKARLAAKKRRH